jgi:hypothetical protein
LPDSAPAGAAVVGATLGVGVAVVATGVLAELAAAGVDEVEAGADALGVPELLLHPAASISGSSNAAAIVSERLRALPLAVMCAPPDSPKALSP